MPHSPAALLTRPLPSSSSSSAPGMYKNQLQELAQRSCFNLPSYSCIREGPDHAPRFKATVSFNGEVFESPGYHTTLRQAEHAAAEVALSTLSTRGPTQSLAARILDETGVCKNLLQETAQRAGVSLPVYTTIRSGPKHLPLFKCMVEVGGRRYMGDPAKTKKQAEKNAALAAWSALKQLSSTNHSSYLLDPADEDDVADKACFVSAAARSRYKNRGVVQAAQPAYAPFSPAEALIRDTRIGGGQYHYNHQAQQQQQQQLLQGAILLLGADASLDGVQRYAHNGGLMAEDGGAAAHRGGAAGLGGRGWYGTMNNQGWTNGGARGGAAGRSCNMQQQAGGGRHQRRHSLSGMENPHELVGGGVGGGADGFYCGSSVSRLYHHQQQHQRIRGLPYQSLSDRFDLNRSSLLEELQQREEEEMLRNESLASSSSSSSASASRPYQNLRSHIQSQSERFDYTGSGASLYLPHLEEDACGSAAAAEEWSCQALAPPAPPSSCFSSSAGVGHHNKEREEGGGGCYKEGWLRGETLLQRLEEQKRKGYKEGWLRGDMAMNKSVSEERSSCRALGEDRFLSAAAAAAQPVLDEETVYSAVAAAVISPPTQQPSSSSSSSTQSSHLSSLWSKSAQWWGSRVAPSSAAAALANTLGLRPAATMAPAVRVRQMVPVCSAPPPPSRRSSNGMDATLGGGGGAANQIPSLNQRAIMSDAKIQLAAAEIGEGGVGMMFHNLRI